MRTLKTALFGATMLTAAAATADAEILNAELLDEDVTVVENAMKVQNFSTLVAAVEAAGLADALMGEGPYTIFAPVDSAFAALPEGTVENLLLPENRETLANILSAHVVPGIYTAADLDKALVDGEIEVMDVTAEVEDGVIDFDTLALTDLLIEKEGSTFYIQNELGNDENFEIIASDIMSSNGVIHAINGVIVPGS